MSQQNISVRKLITESHKTALDHGWWEDTDRNLYEQIALMHSELSEALEELRNNRKPGEIYYDHKRPVVDPAEPTVAYAKPEGFLSELADVFIRIGDTVGRYELTDEFIKVLTEKLHYNQYRPYRHGNKQA